MVLDYFELKNMRRNHPSWRLMTAENGPLIAGFLDTVFRENNVRSISESELEMRLEDYIYSLAAPGGEHEFPRSASDYLDTWADNSSGWLRKFYPQGSDEAFYDMTPSAEKAIRWMGELFETHHFVGTESRLFTSFELLRQIVYGVEQDKKKRIEKLREQRREIDNQIHAIESGDVPTLNKREVRERFIQFGRIAGELLGDFRMVEHNFRELDRNVREKIAAWSGHKGELLGNIFGEHDDIEQTEQGQSFQAFWDFLMSSGSQEELSLLLDRVFALEELEGLTDDIRLKRIHFDWINAGEQTQKTVARLSRQLRRFLDDKSYYENRRITKLLDSIDRSALEIQENQPQSQKFMEIKGIKPGFNLPMERPLFAPPLKVVLESIIPLDEETEIDSAALYKLRIVDYEKLERHIDDALLDRSQINLSQLIELHPLQEGLAELVAYFEISGKSGFSIISDNDTEDISWRDKNKKIRKARIPKVIFQRRTNIDE